MKKKPQPTQEDYAAFEDFRGEVLRAQLLAEAEEQARQGGPPLTEMGLEGLNGWLEAFHAEANESGQREPEGHVD
jgi:hypothetical protein